MSEGDLSEPVSARKQCDSGDSPRKDNKGRCSDYVFSHEFRNLVDITEDQPHVYTHEHSNIMNSNSLPDTPLPGQTFSGSTSPRQLSRGTAATPSHAYRPVYLTGNPLRRSPERDAMLAAIASRTSTPSRQSSGTQLPILQQHNSENLDASRGSPERDMSQRRPQRGLPNPLEGRPNLLPPRANAPSTPLSPHASPFYGSSSQPQSSFAPPASNNPGASNTPTEPQGQGPSYHEHQSPQGAPNSPNRAHASSPYTHNAFQQNNNNNATPHTHQSVQQRLQNLSSPFINPNSQQSPFIHTPRPYNPAFNAQNPGSRNAPPYIHVSPQQHQSPYQSPQQQQHQNPYQSPQQQQQQPQTPYIHAPSPHHPSQSQPPSQDPHSTLSTPRAQEIYPLAHRISSTPLNLPPQEPAARKQFARELLETLEQDKKMLIQKRWETFKEMKDLEVLIGELKERRNEMIARRDWSGSFEGEMGFVGGNEIESGGGMGGRGSGQGNNNATRNATPTMPAAMRAMIAEAGNTTPSHQHPIQHQQHSQPPSTDQTPTRSPQRYEEQNQNQTPTLGQQIRMLDQELKRVTGVHEGYGNMVGNVGDNIEQMWDAVVGLEGEGWD